MGARAALPVIVDCDTLVSFARYNPPPYDAGALGERLIPRKGRDAYREGIAEVCKGAAEGRVAPKAQAWLPTKSDRVNWVVVSTLAESALPEAS